MGYYTVYSLKWEPRKDYEAKDSCNHPKKSDVKFCPDCGIEVTKVTLDRVVAQHIESHKEKFAVEPDGSQADRQKWYEHEADLREMSAAIPNVLFTLHGEGEEAGDIWDAYFLNGKGQKEKAVLTIGSFDERKLK